MNDLGTNGDGKFRTLSEEQALRGLASLMYSVEATDDPDRSRRKAEEAMAGLIALGLPIRHEGGGRYFDFCEVANLLFREGRAGRHPTYRDDLIPNRRRLLAETVDLNRPPQVEPGESDPRRCEVSLRREFNLEGDVPGRPLRLRLPLPYDDPAQREFTVAVVSAPESVRTTRGPGFLEFRTPVPEVPALLVIEVRYTFTAYRLSFTADRGLPRPVALPDEERALYTRPNEGLIQITPAVVDLAASLSRRSDDLWTTVEAFWAFFFDHMSTGYIHHDELDPADPLGSLVRRGWFDCIAGTALLVALLRARGIPARVVQGVMLHNWNNHHWAEFFSPSHGWVPLDLMSWLLSAGRLDDEPWGRLFFGRMDYRLKCQCFPRWVVGPPGVRFPRSWYLDYAEHAGFVEMSFHDPESSRLIYRDLLRVPRSRQTSGKPASSP